jgi:hypothetical protein
MTLSSWVSDEKLRKWTPECTDLNVLDCLAGSLNRALNFGEFRRLWLKSFEGSGRRAEGGRGCYRLQLLLTRECQATNPRDEIYALLAVTSSFAEQLGVYPDYRLNVRDVFALATLVLLQGDQNQYQAFSIPSVYKPGSTNVLLDHLPWLVFDLTISSRTPSVENRCLPHL